MSVVPFVPKERPTEPNETEVEIYGCEECGSTDFSLATAGYIFCSGCDSTIPLMVTKFPVFVMGLLQDGEKDA